MSETKPTPGPWSWRRDGGLIHIESYLGAEDVAGIAFAPEETAATDEANAALMAASPDLLAACKEALPQLRWTNCHGSRCDELIAEIEAAVASAESPR